MIVYFSDLTLAIIRERILAGFVYSPSCLNREVSVLLLNRLVLKGYVEFGTICRQVMDIIDVSVISSFFSLRFSSNPFNFS